MAGLMFKHFLLLLIIVFAFSSLEASNYEIGKRHFENKDYTEAIYYFKKAKEEYSNIDMQIMWALSEEALGKELYVVTAYERILNLDPNNFSFAMKLNNLYKKRELRSQIINSIDNFNYSDYKNSYKAYISKFLSNDKIDLKKLYSNYYGSINSNNLEYIYIKDNSEYQQELMDSLINSRLYANLSVNYSYIHDIDNNDLFFKADIETFAKYEIDTPGLNSMYSKVTAEIGRKFSNTIVTFPISYKYNEILNYYKYETYSIEPKMIFLIDDSHMFDLSLTYSKTSYPDEDMYVLDSYDYGFCSSMRYMLLNNNFQLGVSYFKTTPSNNSLSNYPYSFIEKDTYEMFLSTIFPIQSLKLNFFINYKVIDYTDNTKSYNDAYREREDNFIDIGTNFYTTPTKDTKLFYKINFLYNDTNYEPLNYDKLIFSIGLEFNS